MSRETWGPIAVVLGIALALLGAWSWLGHQREAQDAAQRATQDREREERRAHETEQMRSESALLLAGALPGVELGSDVDAVRAARPSGAVLPSTSRTDPGFVLYQEDLPNGAQVMYAFDEDSGRLDRVQVLSMIDDVEGLAPHLAAMHDRYGSPSGIWDCRDEGGIATRRFTWRHAHVGLADIVLLYGSRISLTLYVTTNEQMTRSLQRAHCHPMDPDALEQFPASSPEDIQRAQEADEGAAPR